MASQQKKRGSLTTVACDRCRTRKTKCNGDRPACSNCIERGDECIYVADPDASPTVALKRKHEALQQRTAGREEFVRLLQTVSEAEAAELLARLRSGEDVDSLVSVGREMLTPGGSIEATSSSSNEQANANAFQDSKELHVNGGQTNGAPLSFRPAPVHLAAASLMVLEPVVNLMPSVPSLRVASDLKTGSKARAVEEA